MKFLITILFMVACGGVSIARADGIGNQIDSMFSSMGSMSNYTPPGATMTARGGIISGGSLEVRNRIMQPQLLGFTPPSFGGGCGGLDLVGGSFSFISKEELTQYLRQIASQAMTYAFYMGLKALCPACADEMDKLQKLTHDLNNGAMNSCRAAHLLGGMNSQAAQSYYSEWMSTLAKDGSDLFSNSNQGPGQNSPALDKSRADPTGANQIIQGNIVWRALNDQNVKSLLPDGDTATLEDILSLTGSIVVCVPQGAIGGGGCPAPTGGMSTQDRPGTPQVTVIEPTLTLRSLVYGTADGGQYQRLVCTDDQTNCMQVQPTNVSDFKGFAQRIREAFVGTDGADGSLGSDGIIGKIAANDGSKPSATQINLANNLGNYGGIVINLAVHNKADAAQMAIDYAPIIAAMKTYALTQELLEHTALAVAQSHYDFNGEAIKKIHRAQDKLTQDYNQIMEQKVGYQSMIQTYMALLETYGSAPAIAVDIPKRL